MITFSTVVREIQHQSKLSLQHDLEGLRRSVVKALDKLAAETDLTKTRAEALALVARGRIILNNIETLAKNLPEK